MSEAEEQDAVMVEHVVEIVVKTTEYTAIRMTNHTVILTVKLAEMIIPVQHAKIHAKDMYQQSH